MTIMADIDAHDLKKARAPSPHQEAPSDDWDGPRSMAEDAPRQIISLNRSPLARKIVLFNLIALMVLVAGVLYVNPSHDSLSHQRATMLASEARLLAEVIEAEMPTMAAIDTLQAIDLRYGVSALVYGADGRKAGSVMGDMTAMADVDGLRHTMGSSTILTDFLHTIWDGVASLVTPAPERAVTATLEQRISPLVTRALGGRTQVETLWDRENLTTFVVTTPMWQNGDVVGAVVMYSGAGEIDLLVRQEREQVLKVFVVALLVSIGLSLVLASAIANPLGELAAAAEMGRARDGGKASTKRVRIPDLTRRPDEIGRLSKALREMVSALYDRIDGNEQFAADVAHEIKNPLASLRSAVGTLRVATRDDQRDKLLTVIDHDVVRLNRLVSDISNASRLDSELVKEEEQPFDLLKMLTGLIEYLAEQAAEKGIEVIQDMPKQPVIIEGLEPRLAQVFVNLISNAISFCTAGDAIRVWVRKRDHRVLVVVEDTGLGIPEAALTNIFNRFYSERPEGQFGNHSGLGLAISKQIVEAHGGVIWAENIHPTSADAGAPPLGARFVVGLPG